MAHKHKFVPVEVAWLEFWGRIEEDKTPKPSHVILACACGRVKLVPAKILYE